MADTKHMVCSLLVAVQTKIDALLLKLMRYNLI